MGAPTRGAILAVGCVLSLLFVFASAASAQQDAVTVERSPQRRGFWIGLGGGYGLSKPSCTRCQPVGSRGGQSAFLKAGGRLGKHTLVGGELNVWNKAVAGATDRAIGLSFVLYDYPRPTSGLFVKGGIGYFSFLETGHLLGGSNGTGLGFLAGVGYDVHVRRAVFLTPVVTLAYGLVGDVTVGSLGRLTGWRQYVVDCGLGITMHPSHTP